MERLAAQVRRLVGATEDYRRALAAELGVSDIDMIALTELAYHGACTPSMLAERLRLTTPSVTALVDRLEQAGLAARRQHPRDRRSVLVELTETGSLAVRSTLERFSADVARAVHGAEPEHVRELGEFLDKIAASLRARATGRDAATDRQ